MLELSFAFEVHNFDHFFFLSGIERAEDIEGETRTLLARDNCATANLFSGVNYLILGNDGQKYMNDNGETW